MKFSLSNIKSLFQSSSIKNIQSARISGDNNVVDQRTTNIYMASPNDEIKRGLLADVEPSWSSLRYQTLSSDGSEGDDSEEIKRIIEYRAISSEGNSATALSLLEKLKSDPRYATGFIAFRLHFNIGIIQQNIGEIEQASVSLRAAHAHCPDDDKAKTGLAFAELLDGASERALDLALLVLDSKGDHQDLAACIVLNAARRLKREIDTNEVFGASPPSPNVLAAYLEYLRELRPEDYVDALNRAFDDNPDNDEVASMWALSMALLHKSPGIPCVTPRC